jgi:hypothetical protein
MWETIKRIYKSIGIRTFHDQQTFKEMLMLRASCVFQPDGTAVDVFNPIIVQPL